MSRIGAPVAAGKRTMLRDVIAPQGVRISPHQAGDLPFVGLEHVERDTGRLLGQARASEMKSAVTVFHPGDVLYARLRPYLNKVAVPDFSGCASAEFLVFRGNDRIDARFLHWVLPSTPICGLRVTEESGRSSAGGL